MNVRLKLFFASLIMSMLSACASSHIKPSAISHEPKTTSTSDACRLFKNNPQWYWEALNTYTHWGVPISVQMAIMQRESDFQAGVRPPKKEAFGFIPWGNVTSAYGYAQALNGTWQQYQQDTKNYNTNRDKFGGASDFIGWYCNKAHQKLGIDLHNAYALYLAYHEGLAGYAEQTYAQKSWLLQVAHTVQQRANEYRQQISQCKYSLPVVMAGH